MAYALLGRIGDWFILYNPVWLREKKLQHFLFSCKNTHVLVPTHIVARMEISDHQKSHQYFQYDPHMWIVCSSYHSFLFLTIIQLFIFSQTDQSFSSLPFSSPLIPFPLLPDPLLLSLQNRVDISCIPVSYDITRFEKSSYLLSH